METIQAFSVIAIALIFGLCGAGTAVAFGNLGGKLIESSARQPELAPKTAGSILPGSWFRGRNLHHRCGCIVPGHVRQSFRRLIELA